jgi:glucosamine kinase
LYLYPQMILVADSGSSKTDWKWVDTGVSFQTSGYNPYVQGISGVLSVLAEELLPQFTGRVPECIYFYGSGFSVPEYNVALQEWMIQNTGASKAIVEHDLLGAARAICQNRAGIAAIMGTGSNSCLYDGRTIVSSKGGHGYLFGDEGSGADLGKRLVQKLLNEELSPGLSQQILEKLACKAAVDLRNRIHGKPRPNVALAALAPLVLALQEAEEIQLLILESFRAFLNTTLLRYSEIRHLSPGFTGSVAWHFKKHLLQVLSEKGLDSSVVLPKPIDQLAYYHERFG